MKFRSLSLALVVLIVLSGVASAQWANSSLDRCMNITIVNATTSSQTNFPAYINLTYDSDMQANYSDLRFYNASCGVDQPGAVALNYEMENYTASIAHIWVAVNLSGANTTLSVYYKNNTPVSPGQNAAAVWNPAFKGVWHMTSTNAVDSTSNGNNGTGTGIILNASGKIDGALNFAGGRSSYVNCSNKSSLHSDSQLTIEAWTNSKATKVAYAKILDKSFTANSAPYVEYTLSLDGSANKYTFELATGGTQTTLPSATISSSNVWHHVVGVYNGSNMKIYVDGILENTTAKSGAVNNYNRSLLIGSNGVSLSQSWNGTIDEVRVSNTARSSEWINQSYQMAYNNSKWVKFGAEQSKPAGSSLAWNQSVLALSSVIAGTSNGSNATVTATGNNMAVTVTNVSGNGTGVIAATPLSLGDMVNGQVQQVQFNCSPGASQAPGYYVAIFNVNSSNFTAGANITVGCTVAPISVDWNQSALGLGSVFPSSSTAKNATIMASGSNTAVAVTAVSGNGTSFISAIPTDVGNLADSQTQQVQFNCSPDALQTPGYYEAVFSVNSSSLPTGNSITVGCTVVAINITWNQSSLSIGAVQPGASSTRNATVTATGSNPGAVVSAMGGNGSGFIAAAPLNLGDMANGQAQQVQFNCSPDALQTPGYYEAVFSVNSSSVPAGNSITAGCTVTPAAMHNLSIRVAYNHNDSWFGEVTVNATVTDESSQPVTGASVNLKVTPPAGRFVNPRTVTMLDDGVWPDKTAGDGVYTVLFDVSLNGSAYTNGTMAMNVSAAKAGFNNGYNASRSFFTFVLRRWYGSTTEDVYANYKVQNLGNGVWFHNVTGVSIYSPSTTATNVTVKIPILNQNITNLAVKGTTVNAYRLENNNTIVIYMNVTSGSTNLVNYSFNASSDLILTLNDKYQTQTIGERIGKNGFVMWNSHIEKEVFGVGLTSEGQAAGSSGLHSVGEDIGMKVVDGESRDNKSHTIDCMERTAIADNSSGTMGYTVCGSCDSYYEWNIHWKNPANDTPYAHMGAEILSATPNSVSLRMTDHGSTNEWASTNRYNVTKTLTFYAGEAYERLNFTIRNIGTATLNTSFVWGREPWIYSGGATNSNDRGAIPANTTSTPQVEEDYTWNELGSNWFAAYDQATNYSTAIIFPANTSADMATFCILLNHTPLGTNSGENQYPIAINHQAFTGGNLNDYFCDWRFGAMAGGEERSVVFYHWGGYAGTQATLFSNLNADAAEIRGG